VGVDFEARSRLSDEWINHDDFAEAILSPREMRIVAALDEVEGRWARLGLWTRKEAVLKGAGRGIIDDLREVEVAASWSALAEGSPTLVRLGGEKWYVNTVSLRVGGLCSVASRERDSFIRWREVCLLEG